MEIFFGVFAAILLASLVGWAASYPTDFRHTVFGYKSGARNSGTGGCRLNLSLMPYLFADNETPSIGV
jgi:hypothetical protein